MKTLKYMSYAQAHVVVENGDTALVSYKTPVATITKDHELYISGLYSTTTRKHIMAFLKEYLPFTMDFASVKQLATKYIKMNIDTGEILPI